MPKSANQKLKLLYLMQLLLQNSDEAHPLSVQQMISRSHTFESGLSADCFIRPMRWLMLRFAFERHKVH
ncbi:MAG: hypothetical protein ACI3VM_06320 [Oscillospiraceae bacterium]